MGLGMGDRPYSRDKGFRAWAALMLWVWMVSRSVCVAHCHGVIFGGEPSVPESSTVSHRCCLQARTHARTEARSAVEADACPTSSDTSTGSDSSQPATPTDSCPTQAVIRLADPLDSLPSIGFLRSFPGSVPWDGLVCGTLDLQERARGHLSRFHSASEPRWDRGFDPARTLGVGLRSLAPPRIG